MAYVPVPKDLVRMLIGTGMRIGERSKGNMVSVCA